MPPAVSDDFLLAGLLGGDTAALGKLIDRYDRLVRYTIFRLSADRCRRDPEWLESVASATWEGFVRSVQREADDLPHALAAYIARIARNRCVSELRRATRADELAGIDDAELDGIPVGTESPEDSLVKLEQLETLRACLAELPSDERAMAAQLEAITERRWRDAAAALSVSESTLRSRWRRTLARLRRCVAEKTGKSVAPEATSGDS